MQNITVQDRSLVGSETHALLINVFTEVECLQYGLDDLDLKLKELNLRSTRD